MKITEKVRNMIRSWLRIEPAQSSQITINETLDFYGNTIKNSIWYRGKSDELTELYRQIPGDRTTFWKASSTAGMEIRKIHTGLPKLIVDVLTSVVMADMQDIEVPEQYADVWENIEKENSFKQLVTDALKKTLYIGDGAFKISVDLDLTDYPIIEFVSGDRVEYVYKRGRLCEVVFNTTYVHNHKEYLLKEYWTLGDDTYDEVDVIKNFPPHVAAEAMKLEQYIYVQKQNCYHQMIQGFGLDPFPAIKALLDELDSDAPKGREPSVEAVAEFAPVEVYQELIYYGGYTMNYIREERARGKCSPWRETIMKAVEEDIISTTGIHGNPVFLMTYEATPEEELAEKIKNNELVITTTHHQLADGTWRAEQYPYKYRLEITGRLNNAARDSTYIILSNTDDITFDQAWKASGLSSNLDDYFDPANAKIVGFR
jgi:hypothetical protein